MPHRRVQQARGHAGLTFVGHWTDALQKERSVHTAWRMLCSLHFCQLFDRSPEPNTGSHGKCFYDCWVIASTQGTVIRSHLMTGSSPKGSPKDPWIFSKFNL